MHGDGNCEPYNKDKEKGSNFAICVLQRNDQQSYRETQYCIYEKRADPNQDVPPHAKRHLMYDKPSGIAKAKVANFNHLRASPLAKYLVCEFVDHDSGEGKPCDD